VHLTTAETRFLTALLREQTQTGCRGPAHGLLRSHAYPEAPTEGAGSTAFAYEVVPLTSMVLVDLADLEEIDDFTRRGQLIADPQWPWSTVNEYRSRLEEARRAWATRREMVH
jgi:hypothetical protein